MSNVDLSQLFLLAGEGQAGQAQQEAQAEHGGPHGWLLYSVKETLIGSHFLDAVFSIIRQQLLQVWTVMRRFDLDILNKYKLGLSCAKLS